MAPTAKTILYGSQARNEARSDSDIDLLILLDGEKMTLKDEESITLPLYELELKTGVSISPTKLPEYIVLFLWKNPMIKDIFLSVVRKYTMVAGAIRCAIYRGF